MKEFSLATCLEGRNHRYFVLADHASNFIPERYGQLGLPDDLLETHVAWDPGAGALAQSVASRLDACAILCNFSRLLVDPNRSRDRSDLVPAVSDMIPIPGNRDLPVEERHRRINCFFDPYHEHLDYEIELACKNETQPFVVAVHTFTPRLMGDAQERPWHIGVLWNHDEESARKLINLLRRETDYLIGDNQPYDARVFNYTVDRHVASRRLRHVTLEIRQDLVSNKEGVERLTSVLTNALDTIA